MIEKPVSWWRKALNYALSGLRSGFGLFPKEAKPASMETTSLEEDRFLNTPEPSLGREPNLKVEEAVTNHPANPEGFLSAADSVIDPAPAAPAAEQILDEEPMPATDPVVEQESFAEAAQPVAEEVIAVEQVIAPELNAIDESIQIEAPSTSANEAPASPMQEVEPETAPPVEAESEPEPDRVLEPLSEPINSSAGETASIPEQTTAEPPAQPAPDLIADEKAAAKLAARQKKLDDAAELSPFSVIVGQVYTGPLDLLLDLIRQQDIDIYDIPIAKITAQFLAYVNHLKATDVDVAGEFIYTASLLIHIKSKMLLPRSPAGPDDTPEDPRRELVERLLEHERFKNAAQMLQQKQMLEAATWTNPGFREFQDDDAAEPEIAADTVDLVRIFRDILERARNRPVIDVQEDSVTVGQMIQFLARRLTLEDKPIALRRLLSHTRSERALVAMFLALLELVRLQAVLLRQDRAFSDIFIKKHTGFDAVMNQGLANALDDWR